MKIHHLNCGTDCPFGGALMDGRSRGPLARLICHCLLIETPSNGLVLVDTGYGMQDVRQPHPRTSRVMRGLLNIRFRQEETALRQVEALGFSARDVRHIILTHLDFDHAGGIADFPQAQVHLMGAELDAAQRRIVQVHLMGAELDAAQRRIGGLASRKRYRPMQLDGITSWRSYEVKSGERWNGFEVVREIDGLSPDILLVPLIGHTWGHAGVAVRQGDGWLLHAGDAYFHADEVRRPERSCPPGLRLYQTMMEVDRKHRMINQDRLRALSLDPSAGVRMICAHDVEEYERCVAGAPLV